MRPTWTGSLSFGLVNIPVRLFKGSQESGPSFHMLHETDLSPIRFARICRSDGKEIPYEHIVRGYEYQKGDYVVLTEDDLSKINVRRTKSIEIVQFVDEKEIDLRYFEQPYYLEPDKGAGKAYNLLREALARSGKVGIAKFVLRTKEHLAALKPIGKVLILEQMRFQAELREPAGLNLPDEAVQDREVEMALSLINQLSNNFIPEDFHDEYTRELEDLVEKKAKGQRVTIKAGAEPQPTGVKDLMSVLKASLEKEQARPR